MTRIRDYIGPYRLARLIRVGNTCQVWEAVREEDRERFALKVLRPDFRNDREERSYLKHEFLVASAMKHPNIIKIYEYNDTGATPYLVLELYNAKNLKQVLREGAAELASYVPKIVEQSAQSLYYMHEEGWVHCDIKPDNYLVRGDGAVRLIDFTIAVREAHGVQRLIQRMKNSWVRRFKPTIRGTRSYMSPEIIRGYVPDQRADVYSFGCVVFELVTGRPPYTGESPDALLKKHISAPIPSAQVFNNNVTPEFNQLIRRMIAKKPDNRPATLWEFLNEFHSTRLFVKSPPPPSQKLTVDEVEELE